MTLTNRQSYALIWLIITVLTGVLTGVPASGQNRKNIVMVKTNPVGAMVYFKGETSFVGVAPFRLHPNFQGIYEVTVVKRGFEKKKHTYMFRGTENGTLNLSLSPKTRFKAGLRSALIPGWGQYYSERKKFGIVLNVLQVGASYLFFDRARTYSDIVDKYDAAKKTFEEDSRTYEKYQRNWQNLQRIKSDADDAFANLEKWAYISAGLWIYNFLDAIIFFPDFDEALFQRSVPTLSMNPYHRGVTASLQFSF